MGPFQTLPGHLIVPFPAPLERPNFFSSSFFPLNHIYGRKTLVPFPPFGFHSPGTKALWVTPIRWASACSFSVKTCLKGIKYFITFCSRTPFENIKEAISIPFPSIVEWGSEKLPCFTCKLLPCFTCKLQRRGKLFWTLLVSVLRGSRKLCFVGNGS